jgi:uncharacterized protein
MTGEFSETDFEALDAWLQRRGKAIHDAVTLEGFLVAVLVCPTLVSPQVWLPKVWGSRAPSFRDLDELNRFTGLVMGLYNDVALALHPDPEAFAPTFYERTVVGQTVVIVDDWCEGFVKGMRLAPRAWRDLKREAPELVRPMELFGTAAGWKALEAGGEVAMHAKWWSRIAPAVRALYRRRIAQDERASAPVASPARHR